MGTMVPQIQYYMLLTVHNNSVCLRCLNIIFLLLKQVVLTKLGKPVSMVALYVAYAELFDQKDVGIPLTEEKCTIGSKNQKWQTQRLHKRQNYRHRLPCRLETHTSFRPLWFFRRQMSPFFIFFCQQGMARPGSDFPNPVLFPSNPAVS